jgi:hypothetical protein
MNCIGPGRWGSTIRDLGVYASYADIHNITALTELTGRKLALGQCISCKKKKGISQGEQV